jgi:ubiquitin-conjugating enzyme E2 J1
VCGQSNKEILAERAEAAKAKEIADGSKRVEEEVPKEITLQYKDKTGKNSESKDKLEQTENRGGPTVDEMEEAELAEGFVQTAPLLPDPSTYPPARPAQGVPQPTNPVSTGNYEPAARAESMQNLQQRNARTMNAQAQPLQERAAEVRRSTDGVPIWIDRAIAGVVVCLIFMILKMLLSS